MKNKKIRIIMAKPGLDGHDRGIKVLARAFRDSGMEVIYLGLRQTPEMIVSAALQEDASVIALSTLNNTHMTIFPKVLNLMKENGKAAYLDTGTWSKKAIKEAREEKNISIEPFLIPLVY